VLMRIKLVLAIVVGLLVWPLAALELPELINLTDDTSNDFSLIVFAENAATVVKNQMLQLKRSPMLASIRRRQVGACFAPCSLVKSSDDMLHSLCIQRI
jgi:hypothetical protein